MKSQVGVEFFLVLSVVVAFSVILYSTAYSEVGKTRALNDAVLSKSAVDSMAQAVDFAFLSGNATLLRRELFVSPNSNCFYNTTSGVLKLYCTISSEYLKELTAGKEQVFSRELLVPRGRLVLSSCAPLTGGWVNVTVRNEIASSGFVNVSCKNA
ncbi:MAG TPA: hypothetical protein VI875_00975 [Candidatus Norongarragalinales archaeon]|nr:hypothetical protein [Candidatus Norongarragalinales archaeon]